MAVLGAAACRARAHRLVGVSLPTNPDPSVGQPASNAAMVRGERAAYVLAVLILVVGGALLRTVILNWIVGPAIVVACVAFATPVLARLLGPRR